MLLPPTLTRLLLLPLLPHYRYTETTRTVWLRHIIGIRRTGVCTEILRSGAGESTNAPARCVGHHRAVLPADTASIPRVKAMTIAVREQSAMPGAAIALGVWEDHGVGVDLEFDSSDNYA